jgi:hypothetical protein
MPGTLIDKCDANGSRLLGCDTAVTGSVQVFKKIIVPSSTRSGSP